MDYKFPQQLFPSFYNCGPPDSVLKQCVDNWGCYDRIRPQGGSGPLSSWTFTSRHQFRGETWRHTEPLPVPLLSPKRTVLWPSVPPDPLDFTEHMQNFFMDHSQDAFECMGEILGENFDFKLGVKEKKQKDPVYMFNVNKFLDTLKYKICLRTYSCKPLTGYGALMSDVVHAIPPNLLGSLLYEELTEQRNRLLFAEGATGGALAFVPFARGGGSSQRGCLLYPRGPGLDCLNFHRVELQHHRGGSSHLDASSSDPCSFQLKGPVRQISCASLFDDCCVAVRSDHLCGVWRFGEASEPRSLQVVSTGEVATCVGVSPHVLGEVLVASESGVVKLWTVGRGMQKVREEDRNLYFNAKSQWRWCEFSAHPRVMLYADRTGAELTDIRVNPVLGHTLFRISSTSECRSGERLVLSRYLADIHPFHHLITTQHSAYIMDERFPSVPMLKWDHMMKSPPMFCHVVPDSGGTRTAKVLLGSHSSQEITLLQYSGGRAEACSSRGPPQSLHRPKDSLKHLPVQLPHRLDVATNRLSSPAAGLTCIQKKGGEAGGEECLCVLQLTEAGDIFYQILEPEQPDVSRPPAAEDEAPKEATTPGRKTAQQPDSQLVVSDTSSDEDMIGPTQHPATRGVVAETPEREQRASDECSDSSSEDSEAERRGRGRKRLFLPVVVNDSELDQGNESGTGVEDGRVDKNGTHNSEEPNGGGEMAATSSHATPVQLSATTLVTWKRWLQKLMRKSGKVKPRADHLPHFTIPAKDLNLSNNGAKDLTEEGRVQSLRRDLRACMSRRSLLVRDAVSASLGDPDLVPVPDPVDTEVWTDELSRRLTLSWEGEEAWRAWWEDQLGLNKEQKVEALRRKRRRQKEARRAAGRRLELSSSFTSSVGYQLELDSFSDSGGWSSAASQWAWSDVDSRASQSEGLGESGTPRAATPSAMPTDTPVATPTATPQRVKDRRDDQQTPSSSRLLTLAQALKPDSTPSSQRRNKRPADDYLSSLFGSQDEPSQHDSYFLDEEGSAERPPPRPVASSSQLRSSQPTLRTPRADLSQSTSVYSGFSQSLSQSSQGRLGPSQASQPRKKSRMGF